MQNLQKDCYSLQAVTFMKQWEKWIPDTLPGHILKKWDYHYKKEAQAPVLFEAIYRALLKAVFSPMFGKKAWEIYGPGHAFFGFNFGNFDRIYSQKTPSGLIKETKESLFRRVIRKTLAAFEGKKIPTWGQGNHFKMNYLLFDGKLPQCFGFDKGPIELNGNRATIDTFKFTEKGNGRSSPRPPTAHHRFISRYYLQRLGRRGEREKKFGNIHK